jgi:ATP-dependent Clp endopeptidase proteolytic subunit ClpP
VTDRPTHEELQLIAWQTEAAKSQDALYRIQAEKGRLEIETLRRDLADDDASADANCVYLFTDAIFNESVLTCVARLGEWHRRDPEADMRIILNSPGGVVSDGLALYDTIREFRNAGHKIEVHGQGQVLSMSAIVLQAATVRSMSENAYLMVHEVQHGGGGRSSQMRDESLLVQRIQNQLCEILASRSRLSVEEIARKWDRQDWWMSAAEALETGLIDEIRA